MDREFEPNLDDERIVDLTIGEEAPNSPPTVDPEERIEVNEEEDDAVADAQGS